MNITEHFALSELARTDHRGLADRNLLLAAEHVSTLIELCSRVLEPIRNHFRQPVVIHSGFRSPELNAAIGGSATSQHMRGEAADLHVVGVPLEEVWRWFRDGRDAPAFGQVILEGVVAGKPSWLHVSLGAPWRAPERCGELMTWSKDKGYTVVARVRR